MWAAMVANLKVVVAFSATWLGQMMLAVGDGTRWLPRVTSFHADLRQQSPTGGAAADDRVFDASGRLHHLNFFLTSGRGNGDQVQVT